MGFVFLVLLLIIKWACVALLVRSKGQRSGHGVPAPTARISSTLTQWQPKLWLHHLDPHARPCSTGVYHWHRHTLWEFFSFFAYAILPSSHLPTTISPPKSDSTFSQTSPAQKISPSSEFLYLLKPCHTTDSSRLAMRITPGP